MKEENVKNKYFGLDKKFSKPIYLIGRFTFSMKVARNLRLDWDWDCTRNVGCGCQCKEMYLDNK